MAQPKLMKKLSKIERRARTESYLERLPPNHPLTLEYKRIAAGKGESFDEYLTPLFRCKKGCLNRDKESPAYGLPIFAWKGAGAHVNNTHINPATDEPWPGHEIGMNPAFFRLEEAVPVTVETELKTEGYTMSNQNQEIAATLAMMQKSLNALMEKAQAQGIAVVKPDGVETLKANLLAAGVKPGVLAALTDAEVRDLHAIKCGTAAKSPEAPKEQDFSNAPRAPKGEKVKWESTDFFPLANNKRVWVRADENGEKYAFVEKVYSTDYVPKKGATIKAGTWGPNSSQQVPVKKELLAFLAKHA